MSDREVMIAVYAAIEKLYDEVTGKRLRVEVPLTDGGFAIIQSPGRATNARSLDGSAS